MPGPSESARSVSAILGDITRLTWPIIETRALPCAPQPRYRAVPQLDPGLIALLAAMQSGNLARMGNIAGRDHTSTKW